MLLRIPEAFQYGSFVGLILQQHSCSLGNLRLPDDSAFLSNINACG